MSTPEKKNQSPKVTNDRVKLGDFARNVHRINPEKGVTPLEVLEPSYWVHVAEKFRVGDVVEVFPEGGEWYGTYLVTSQSRVHVKLAVLVVTRLGEEQKEDPKAKDDAPFKVEHKGSIHKWSVIRVADKAYIKDGFDTKDEVNAWLKENEADLLKA